MPLRLNPNWCKMMREKVTQFKFNGNHIDAVISESLPAKWLIELLATEDIAFRVLQLGGGVRKITTRTRVCPKCHGTGEC